MKVSFTQKTLNDLSGVQNRKLRSIAGLVFSVLLLFCSTFAYAQNTIVVKGRISNENGEPVSSASVIVKGRTNGVNSNDNGRFEINAPANGTLIISSVGFA